MQQETRNTWLDKFPRWTATRNTVVPPFLGSTFGLAITLKEVSQ